MDKLNLQASYLSTSNQRSDNTLHSKRIVPDTANVRAHPKSADLKVAQPSPAVTVDIRLDNPDPVALIPASADRHINRYQRNTNILP
jgi:hypothetical protein